MNEDLEAFLKELRSDVTENLYDEADYVRNKVDQVMIHPDLEALYTWAQENGVSGSSNLNNRQRVIDARMRVIIRRAYAKRNTIANKIAIDYPNNPKFGRF